MQSLLDDYAFTIPYEDKARDIAISSGSSRAIWPRVSTSPGGDVEFQVLQHHFYRNKGAYIVGRIVSGGDSMPFVLPILHNDAEAVYVDTVLFGSDKVSVLFSFTRSYFPGGCQHTLTVCTVPAATDAGQTHFGNLQFHGLQQARQNLLPSLRLPAYGEYPATSS